MKGSSTRSQYHDVRIPEPIWKEATAFYRANQEELRERYGIQNTRALIWRATLEYIQQLRQAGLRR